MVVGECFLFLTACGCGWVNVTFFVLGVWVSVTFLQLGVGEYTVYNYP